jgi:ribosomal protein L21
MIKIALALLFFTSISVNAEITFYDIFKDMPKVQKLVYSGRKFLVGKIVIEIDTTRETKNHLLVRSDENVYLLGVKAHQSIVLSEMFLKDYKPKQTIFREIRKKKMRFNYFHKDYYEYIRITKFDQLIGLDASGKIVSPKGFNPKNHEIKRSKHKYGTKNTLVFDPNLLLLAIPYIDAELMAQVNKMDLIFTTMDHVLPFKLKIVKEENDRRFIEIIYENKFVDKVDILFNKIIVDTKRKILQRVTGREKHVGEIYIELKKVTRSSE